MSLNKYKPHIFVVPEDDANREMALGFVLQAKVNRSVIQILRPCGGWNKVMEDFLNNHIPELQKYRERRLVLLMDFDDRDNRRNQVTAKIPNDLTERVFVLGVQSEPEHLKSKLGKTFEEIGELLAKQCSDNILTLWTDPLLKDNLPTVDQMASLVNPFLFASG